MAGNDLTMLVAPELGFAELSAQLGARGCLLTDASAEPLVSGEPEWAVFENGSDCRIHYTFNPVATFRMLEFHGDGAPAALAAVAPGIPTVDWTRARSFLRSANPRDQWLGTLAAQQLGDIRLRPMVASLTAGSEPRVAAAARAALASLPDEGAAFEVADAWRDQVADQRRRPGHNVLFGHLPDVELKRQVLRGIAHEGGRGAGVERLLRTALEDRDPEVRLTAMLATARLRQRVLAPAVRDADVPTDRATGAPPGDRLYYARLQRFCLRYLAWADDPEQELATSRRLAELETALRGEQPVVDDETLLWHALVTPLDLGDPPSLLPPGVVETSTGYELSLPGGSIELCWVGPVAHWLGGLNGAGPPKPVRAVTTRPFFVSMRPLTATPGQAGPRWAGSFGEAMALLDALAAAISLPVRAPTADEWETAARGPDGRFYPWGVGLQNGWESTPSPWGLVGWGSGSEWAVDDATGGPTVVNGDRPLPVATRTRLVEAPPSGIRLVLPT